MIKSIRSIYISNEIIGRRVILPSSYIGGNRFMNQLYQDSMAIVRYFGHPTLFITFTANAKWHEITEAILPGQTPDMRPDIVVRVFYMKVKSFLSEIKKKNIFGAYEGCVWTIEYQKRGLPHMHLLLFLQKNDQFLTPKKIDEIICAELPSPTTQPQLYEVVTTTMLHGLCGGENLSAPCMTKKYLGDIPKCSKHFPREFQSQTMIQADGYPFYRRRNNGQEFIRYNEQGEIIKRADNRWVVPYNPYLCWRYKAHINVEICASVRAIKYIHKYIYKGSDRITIEVQNKDKIRCHLQARYIGPCEAMWRLLGYKVHQEKPSVQRLDIHLPGML